MSFDEQPDSHCACCRSWEEREYELRIKLGKAEVINKSIANLKSIKVRLTPKGWGKYFVMILDRLGLFSVGVEINLIDGTHRYDTQVFK